MYEKLKITLASDEFLEKLNSLSLDTGATSSDSILVKTEGEKDSGLFLK